jgi:hypothetical protein
MEDTGLVTRLTRTVRQFGVMRTLYDLALRAVNRLVYFRVLKAVSIDTPDPQALERRPEYGYGFLSRALVLAFAVDPQYEMNERFLGEALANEDRCYGIVHGEALASYGWYSKKPTVALTDDLELRFDPIYVYMYKGFTHEGYRGQRLHAAGMALALQEYRAEGSKGLVSYVESNNFSSLKSCYRMGYVTFGHVVVLRAGGRYFIGRSKGCRERGFELAPVARRTA